MFEDATLKLSDRVVLNYNQMWPLYVHFLYMFNYSDDAKTTWMRDGLIYTEDAPGNIDSWALEPAKKGEEEKDRKPLNPGLYDRSHMIRNSRRVTTEGIIPWDLAQSDKLILHGVPIFIEFRHANDYYRLLAEDHSTAYKLVIDEIQLKIQRITLTPDLIRGIDNRLSMLTPCVWEFKRYDLASAAISFLSRQLLDF